MSAPGSALHEEDQHLRTLFQAAPFLVAATEGPAHRLAWGNDCFAEFFGAHAVVGAPLHEAVPDLVAQHVVAAMDGVYAGGPSRELRAVPLTIPTAGPPRRRMMDLSVHPRRGPDGAVVGLHLHGADVTSGRRQRSQAARRAQEQRTELEALYNKAPVGLVMFDRDLRFVRVNERLAEINGLPPDAHPGRLVWDVVPDPNIRRIAEPLLRGVLETGEGCTVELEGETLSQPGVVRQWIEHFYPLLDEQGDVVGVGAAVEEVTERHRAERRRAESEYQREILVQELAHRVKNTLATVQSIVMRTLSGHVEAAPLKVLTERLEALAKTHTLLAENCWAVDLTLVAQGELAPYGARAHARGPEVALHARAAVALTLTLHELATNAAKHGALSGDSGRIDLSWEVAAESGNDRPALMVVWKESGGQPVAEPSRSGFGTRLIRRVVPHDLDGTVDLRFEPTGAVCRLTMPMHEVCP
ncbi:sensor histidine kinase, putative [Caenispirillum salinarum AK4]|uniref:histidine kinase n=1 Tax=Caenispirillum salinarum AK4 TaxID=1238182 RepID=K9H4R4_9PROT|nr:PAS domain-containing protein [Caenispirillum salinarum]EKV32069.1 sensor histidine kinase, putative [Caenispirillum salinarum AK4]